MSVTNPLRLGWFATGTGTTSPKLLSAALEAIESGHLGAEIVVVFSNREPGEDSSSDGFHSAIQRAGIPLVTLSDKRFRRERGGQPARKGEPLPAWRADYDREVIRLLQPYAFDVGVLAGYKLILGPEAADRWDLLNLHPAMPGGPKGIWQDVTWEMIAARAESAGVMIHLATPELDEGPAVAYCTYSICGPEFDHLWRAIGEGLIDDLQATEGEDSPLFQAIRSEGVRREVPLLIETLRAFAQKRMQIKHKCLVDSDGVEIAAVDLTGVIESIVATTT